MDPIRIVWGRGRGPTATASYDAALADANVHDYNLVTVSSVVPADAPLEVAGRAPDLGPVGDRLTVVQGRRTLEPGDAGPGVAGLGWARSADRGPGIFYEATGSDPDAVREAVERGLDRGCSLREWTPEERDVLVRETDGDAEEFATVVALAVYGTSDPIL